MTERVLAPASDDGVLIVSVDGCRDRRAIGKSISVDTRDAGSCRLRFSHSSRSKRNSRNSVAPRMAYLFFQTWNVASLMPYWRHTSATGVPLAGCRRARTICSSVYLELVMSSSCILRTREVSSVQF